MSNMGGYREGVPLRNKKHQEELLYVTTTLGEMIKLVEDFRSHHDPDDLYMALRAELAKLTGEKL